MSERGDSAEQGGVVGEEHGVEGGGRRGGPADRFEEERELIERVEVEVAAEEGGELRGGEGARHGGERGEEGEEGARRVRGDGVGVGGREAARRVEVLGDDGARGGDGDASEAVGQVPQLRGCDGGVGGEVAAELERGA